MIRLFYSLILLFLPLLLLSQDIIFEASAEPNTVVEGGFLKINFSLQNADGGALTPPDFSAFKVLGQETTPSFSFGVFGISKSVVYSYYLRPKALGSYTIGSARIRVNNKTYKTNPLTVKVVKPGAPGTPGALLEKIKAGKGIFLSAEVSHPEAYLGQQIIVDYKLYTSVSLERYNILSESDYPGFYAKDIQRFDSSVKLETIEGEQYRTKVLQRVAVFPQKTGLLIIDPMQMNVRISLQQNRRAIQQNIASEKVNIQVSTLPEFQQPASFSGAIGQYTFESFHRNAELSTDDVMIIGLTLRGQGDVKQIQAPSLDLGPEFEVYDPEAKESIYQEAGVMAGTKTFQYMILPKKPGSFQYQPVASYFDTDSMRYVELIAAPINISVRKGRLPLATEESLIEEDPALTISPNRTEDRLRKRRQGFFGSIWFYLLSSIPIGFGIFAWQFKQKQIRDAAIDPDEKRRQLAQQIAEARLVTAKTEMAAGNYRVFYDEIAKATWTYLSDKLSIPASDLSKQNIQEKLETIGIGESWSQPINELLRTCDMALFAGFDQSEKMPEVYENAVHLISNLEGELIKAKDSE